MKLQLVIGNKNYSSWSMRPWVLLRQAGIPFEEVMLKFGDDGKPKGIEAHSPTRKVPVLKIDGQPIWDSLAIAETMAEMFPEKKLWPAAPEARGQSITQHFAQRPAQPGQILGADIAHRGDPKHPF